MSDAPNTKQCAVPLDVPREPSQYQATMHLGQRVAERVKPAVPDTGQVIEECIRRGYCQGAREPQNVDHRDAWVQCFSFTADVYDIRWRLIVGLTRAGYLGDGTHDAVTIYRLSGDTDD